MRFVFSLILLGACATATPDLEIIENQQPLEDCSLSDERTDRAIVAGTFDLAVGDRASYLLTPLVRNRTAAPLTVTTARVRTIESDGYLQFRCGGESCSAWDLDLCADGCPVIPAKSSASFEVPALERVVSGYFQNQMDAAVIEGRNPPEFDVEAEIELIAGDIVSPVFTFPIRLCLGCLVTFPIESDQASLPGPDCCGFSRGDDGCYPGQDDTYSCRLCTFSVPEICNFGRRTCS